MQTGERPIWRNWPNIDKTSEKYLAKREALADLHNRFGSESFELRYNLRAPIYLDLKKYQ
jgi:hypothetical protein